jgi:hypothetical protein
MAASFSGGGSRSTWREPSTMGKQLVSFITCGCESSAPFFVIYKADNVSYRPYVGVSTRNMGNNRVLPINLKVFNKADIIKNI